MGATAPSRRTCPKRRESTMEDVCKKSLSRRICWSCTYLKHLLRHLAAEEASRWGRKRSGAARRSLHARHADSMSIGLLRQGGCAAAGSTRPTLLSPRQHGPGGRRS
eukprot:CAMPEP_0170268416 /NCGR_PEP_ID=MMETSP0116_2-20130129/34138_1 /TAXON_ID=400756 /ORGANISM="Durinskia baltica, Strain CSIRO CS-38" /LENGTH=106 /DNA_ID=CAMNT_0010519579 /DNA_START=36 /DNA_END=352 /DNA_ORIENTATION=+